MMQSNTISESEILKGDEKQVRMIEHQRTILQSVKDASDLFAAEVATGKTLEDKKRAHEFQHWKFLNEERGDSILESCNEVGQATARAIKLAPSTLTERLHTHDRLIQNLDQLPVISSEDIVHIQKQKDHVEVLTNTLKQLEVETMQTKLNRVFLEALHEHELTKFPANEEEDGRILKQVRGDLDSLYDDIDVVAGMLVAQAYGDPLSAALNSTEEAQRKCVNTRSDTMRHALHSITAELETLTQRFCALQSQRILMHEIDVQLQRIRQRQGQPVVSSSRMKSTVAQSLPQPGFDSLLQHLDLRSPSNTAEAEVENAVQVQAESLEKSITSSLSAMQTSLVDARVQRRCATDVLQQANESSKDDLYLKIDELDEAIARSRLALETAFSADVEMKRKNIQTS